MEIKAKVYTRPNGSGVQYARIVVPKTLRPFVAKPALWKSLSTKDEKEAAKEGSIVAASTQLVLQEVSDAYAEAVVVTVETELVGNKFDLSAELDKISNDDIDLVAKDLRKKLGIKTDDADKPSGGNQEKVPKKSISTKKAATGKSDADEPKKMEQSSIELSDGTVAHYLEKRPHGVYRLRVWVSRKLQRKFGQREVRQTLETRDKDEAILRAKPLLENVLLQLQRLSNTV